MSQFNVFVKNLSGKQMTFQVTLETKVSELKMMINEKIGTQFNDIYLATTKNLSDDNQTMEFYCITSNSTIYLLARLRG